MQPQAKEAIDDYKLRRGKERILPYSPRGSTHTPTHTSVLEVCSPELWDKKFLLFQGTQFAEYNMKATGNKSSSYK